jgi:hypothetical protein
MRMCAAWHVTRPAEELMSQTKAYLYMCSVNYRRGALPGADQPLPGADQPLPLHIQLP